MSLFDILNAEENGNKVEVRYNRREVCIATTCPFCGHDNKVEVNKIDFLDWLGGEFAQNAFPYLSVDEREKLISGCCPQCWDKYFGSDEEPDPDEVDIHGNTFGGDE